MNAVRIFILSIIITVSNNAFTQITSGITHIQDTSYNINSEYNKLVKKYPDIKPVAEFHNPSVLEKRNIAYCSTGERELMLDAFYPASGKQKRAAIMIIHGGGWRSGNRAQHHPLAQRLASLGYVCFTPEYRLSTEALYPAAVYDLKVALRWIHKKAKKYNIDTNHIAVLGFSAGGQLAALLATTNANAAFEQKACLKKYSSAVHALVDLDGTLSFVHPESGEGDDSKKISASTYWFGYNKKDNYALLESASPLTHVSKYTPPTIFINSSVERMHAGRNDFIKVLNENNIYNETHTMEGAPHSFPLFDPWFEPMVKYTDDFLKKVFHLN